MAKKPTKAERDAEHARVQANALRLRQLAEKAQAELSTKKRPG